ncbi:hypothetical protein MIR68_001936 [Amoeboaphelidium protococcarum]|nr:hypothetical protein MIR68_001936 [Amoeboaphelidium protococcarum]
MAMHRKQRKEDNQEGQQQEQQDWVGQREQVVSMANNLADQDYKKSDDLVSATLVGQQQHAKFAMKHHQMSQKIILKKPAPLDLKYHGNQQRDADDHLKLSRPQFPSGELLLCDDSHTASSSPVIEISNLNLVDQSQTQILYQQHTHAVDNGIITPNNDDIYRGRSKSLLGSYEESIINGRMSTCPSRPIAFICDLGVISVSGGSDGRFSSSKNNNNNNGGGGKSRKKSQRKFKTPSHVMIPFKASYYQYGLSSGDFSASGLNVASSSARPDSPLPRSNCSGQSSLLGRVLTSSSQLRTWKQSLEDNSSQLDFSFVSSSPYTGIIQLSDAVSVKSRMSLDAQSSAGNASSVLSTSSPVTSFAKVSSPLGYRIPARGRLQVMIKNTEHGGSVAKLFFVSYDLSDIPDNQSSVMIRQRQYIKLQDGGRGALRHAIQISFSISRRSCMKRRKSISAKVQTDGSGGDNVQMDEDLELIEEYRYYVSKAMRVVFYPAPPEEEYEIVQDYIRS